MTNGIINVYKENGYTSHDVVAKLRGILKFRHIGHTGTLDPMAEGVLPVCIGSATKLCDMLTDKIKVYDAVVLFGTATDTEDITGSVLKTLPVCFDEDELKNALSGFIGDILQMPPMYSAIKLNGKKLYEIARAGKSCEVEKRPVTIHDIELTGIKKDENGVITEAEIKVTCGKGTYIRSLCRDIGEALNTCACMKQLTRLKTGKFEAENAVRLSDIEEHMKAGKIDEIILPIDKVFDEYEEIRTIPDADKLIHNGNPLRKREVLGSAHEGFFRAYDSLGDFCGVYKFDTKTGKFKPDKMFLTMGAND